MSPSLLDHLLTVLLLGALPAYGWFDYRRLRRGLATGAPEVRLREYRATIALQWGLAAVTVALWLAQGRTPAALGLALPPDGRSALGAGVTALALAALAAQWFAIRWLDAEGRARLARQLEGARDLLPTTPREQRWFRALALTAGVCEEILYRGFLIAWCAAYLGEWAAVPVAGAVFGLGHFYQGLAGMAKTAAVGAVVGVLYLLTDSLLWPMILHAAVNLQGGAIGHRLSAQGPA